MRPWPLSGALIISAGCVAACLVLTPPAGSAHLTDEQGQEATDAAKLFGRHCAKCHGGDGRARRLRGMLVGARNLTNPRWQERVTDDQIRAAIEKGPAAMPSFAEKLSSKEIDTLVQYVRRFKRDDMGRPSRTGAASGGGCTAHYEAPTPHDLIINLDDAPRSYELF